MPSRVRVGVANLAPRVTRVRPCASGSETKTAEKKGGRGWQASGAPMLTTHSGAASLARGEGG
jgi:hypothetical protein